MKKKKEKIPKSAKVIHKMFDHLLPYETIEVPVEHRHRKKNIHSLRCFKMIYQRDENKNKLKDLPKVRCKRHVEKGYLFCKFHGGRKQNNLVIRDDNEIKRSEVSKIYKDVYTPELGNLLNVFLNDPNMLDLKPELAGLRTIMMNYIKVLNSDPKESTVDGVLDYIQNTLYDEEMTKVEKYKDIKEIILQQNDIANGSAIDRIIRCVEATGKTIERINKLETKADYMLTPDGLKIILRTVVNLIRDNVQSDEVLKAIKDGMLKVSVETKGDLSKFQNKDAIIDAETL